MFPELLRVPTENFPTWRCLWSEKNCEPAAGFEFLIGLQQNTSRVPLDPGVYGEVNGERDEDSAQGEDTVDETESHSER